MTDTHAPARFDCILVGGGLVGQTLAVALGAHGLSVAVVERADPDAQLAPGHDGRASAIASASARMLRALGLGEVLDSAGCAIRAIRVTDGYHEAGSDRWRVHPRFLHFDSAEVDPAEPLGIMVENRALRAALLAKVRAEPLVTLIAPASIRHVVRGPNGALVELSGGRVLRAPVVLACDGRQSSLRAEAGIRLAEWQYDGTALVTMLRHQKPHGHVASELFYADGPFAQLPMRDVEVDGVVQHRSALVWTVRRKDADGVLALSPRAIAHEAEKRMGGFLGALALIAPVESYPLNLQHAERYWAERLILVGDAAHGIHPIAGQGLNMGLRDVAALTEVLSDSARLGLDLGAPEVARRYERWRRSDNSSVAFATDTLARLFGVRGRLATEVRATGMGIVNRIAPLRRGFMTVARGEAGDLPPLLRGELG